MCGPWLTIEKEFAAHLVGLAGSGQPDNSIGALGGRTQHALCQATEPGKSGLYARRIGPTRVHAVDHNVVLRPCLSPELSEHRERPFGSRVGHAAVVFVGRHDQFVAPQFLGIHASRDHINDPGRLGMIFQQG